MKTQTKEWLKARALTLGVIIGILFLIGLVSATYNLTAGESLSIDLEEEFEYYLISENSTLIDLNITSNGTIITITPSKYLESTSFDITFFNKEEEIVEQYYSSGGNSGSYISWQCGEWGECIEGISTRSCYKTINPSTTREETKTCSQESGGTDHQKGDKGESEKTPGQTTTNFLTGAVIGVNNFVKSSVSLIIGAIILIAGIIVIIVTRKKKSDLHY